MKRLMLVGFLVALISTSYAGDFYSGMSKVDKETCLKAASIGEAKGKKDRKAGIYDNNKMDFAFKICSKCDIGTKAELATCYENGYDIAYYNRY
jgi:hypothetical protein